MAEKNFRVKKGLQVDNGTISLKEQASANSDTAAYGQLWVKTATPNELYFTTDAGDDIQLTSGTSNAGGKVSAVTNGADNRIATFSSADALNGESGLTFDGSNLLLTSTSSDQFKINYDTDDKFALHVGTDRTKFRYADTGGTLKDVLTFKENGTNIPRVGVNQINPETNFHVGGDIKSTSSGSPTLYVGTTSTNSQQANLTLHGARNAENTIGQITFSNIDDTDDPDVTYDAAKIIAFNDGGLNAGGFKFQTVPSGSSTTLATAMTITENGRVGIGTSSPSSKLEVASTITVTGDDESITFDGGNKIVGDHSVDGFQIRNNENEAIVFKTNGNNTRMSIEGDGKVGIGTTSPEGVLEIEQATTTGHALKVYRNQSSSNMDSSLVFLHDDSQYADEVTLHVKQDGTGYAGVFEGGNVGINQTSPAYTLDVAGSVFIGNSGETTALTGSASLEMKGDSALMTFKADNASSGDQIAGIRVFADSYRSAGMVIGDYNNTDGTTTEDWLIGRGYASTNKVGISATPENGGDEYVTAVNETQKKVIIAADNDDIDFQIKGTSSTYFHADAADERIGIGTTSPSETLHVQSATAGVLIESTATSGEAPVLDLYKNDTGPAVSEAIGTIKFSGENDQDQKVTYAEIQAFIEDETDATENAALQFYVQEMGTPRENLRLASNQITFNNNERNVDVLIKSDDGSTNFFSDAGTNRIGIGTTSPASELHVVGHIQATTKSFVIDHPSKKGMTLRHGSLEGPEHAVYVRGQAKGNLIDLPDYWTDLVDEESITVQLTPKYHHQTLYVKSVDSEKVVVGSPKDTTPEFYYLIHAERKDVDKMVVEY